MNTDLKLTRRQKEILRMCEEGCEVIQVRPNSFWVLSGNRKQAFPNGKTIKPLIDAGLIEVKKS